MNRATILVLLGGLGLTAIFVLAPGDAPTGPYLPSSDAVVLEQVPKSAPRPSGPLSADDAAARAQTLIEEARRAGGDPRLLGRAQAVLAPWWGEAAPPPRIRLLRATLKQSFHDFEGALGDLEALDDAQSWLTRATVLSVLARYDEARAACEKVDVPLPAAVCQAQVLGVTGEAAQGVELLNALQPAPAERAWVLSVKGELQRWLGDDAAAKTSLEQALALDATDTYSRLLLAQLLLDGGKPGDAVKLFEGRPVNDSELLMLVLALSASGGKDLEARRAELDERVAANRQRGETLHQREESRYALTLEQDAAKALELAQKNWAVQKEPADARVLLEAAVAAKNREAAAPVVQWMDRTRFTDPRLRALVKELP